MNYEYGEKVIETLKNFVDDDLINEASKYVAKCLDEDGLIYIFGCGHSHIFGEEFFYRAGGLANVYPILYEPIMLHKGAMQSSINEKENDYIKNFIGQYNFTENDIIFVISTSGINPVPIDVAKHAYEEGARVITISSFTYKYQEKSRHVKGLYLSDIGNINIDNGVVYGDAIISSKGVSHSPISTIVGIYIMHQIISNAIDKTKISPPIFKSGNISGSNQHNRDLVIRYNERIPLLANNLEQEL